MTDFQTLNCCYTIGIKDIWSKFCMALVMMYDLLSKQNLEPLGHLLLCTYSQYTPMALLSCCDNYNIKDWSIRLFCFIYLCTVVREVQKVHRKWLHNQSELKLEHHVGEVFVFFFKTAQVQIFKSKKFPMNKTSSK